MNLRRLIKKRYINDAFIVAPSNPLVNRLVKKLEESRDMIKRYFPDKGIESEYLQDLNEMVNYFNDYDLKY